MLRFLAQTIIGIGANALGLLAASSLLSGFSINGVAFVTAVLVYSASTLILGPFIAKVAITNIPALMGGIALVNTLVGLLLTRLITDGLSITGVTTWVIATLIVWLFALIANLLLPLVLFKKTLEKHQESKKA